MLFQTTQEDSMAEVGNNHSPELSIAKIRMHQITAVNSLRLMELRQCVKNDEVYTQP